MGPFIQAPGVIIKQRLKKASIVSLTFFIFLLMIMPERELIKIMLPTFIAIYMVIEDINDKTVDIRLCLALFCSLLVITPDKYEFALNVFNGYVFFSLYFLVLSAKYPKLKNETDLLDTTTYQYFLPFMAGGEFIWILFKYIFKIPSLIELTAFEILPITFIWLLAWGCLSFWIKHRKKEDSNLVFQEVFGRGDFYICVISFAFFGAENCLIMLFIALLLFGIFFLRRT
jgi:hypothetical protein